MRVILAESDKTTLRHLAQRLSDLRGIAVTDLCSDLTQTFNAVEHRPPQLVILSASLVARPEFEMMDLLFRTLGVAWLAFRAKGQPALAGGIGADRLLDPDQPDDAILARLHRAVGAGTQPPPRASAGLLRSVGHEGESRLILIGSSTGGIDALLAILDMFPADCPPTLIVQHPGASYSAGLARLLDRNAAPEVREAGDGDVPTPGRVLLAPGADHHLVLAPRAPHACTLQSGARISGHRPSVDALFHWAVPMANRVTAALLTGMGRDGAEGLLALRRAGARTIAQDRETSVVYGMPGYAVQIGAAERELPLSAIGSALLNARQKVKA